MATFREVSLEEWNENNKTRKHRDARAIIFAPGKIFAMLFDDNFTVLYTDGTEKSFSSYEEAIESMKEATKRFGSKGDKFFLREYLK